MLSSIENSARTSKRGTSCRLWGLSAELRKVDLEEHRVWYETHTVGTSMLERHPARLIERITRKIATTIPY